MQALLCEVVKSTNKMKKLLSGLVFILLISSVTMGLTSCSDNSNKSEVVDMEHKSKYVCPMYCEGSGSEQPGDCPVCHMSYMENKEYKAPK